MCDAAALSRTLLQSPFMSDKTAGLSYYLTALAAAAAAAAEAGGAAAGGGAELQAVLASVRSEWCAHPVSG